MTDGVFNERGHVDGSTEANAVHKKGSVSRDICSLGGQQEIVADEMVPSVQKAVEGNGADM